MMQDTLMNLMPPLRSHGVIVEVVFGFTVLWEGGLAVISGNFESMQKVQWYARIWIRIRLKSFVLLFFKDRASMVHTIANDNFEF